MVDNWEDEAAMLFDKNAVIDKRVEISFIPIVSMCVPSRILPYLPRRGKGD